MYLRNLYEQIERDRKKRRNNIIGWVFTTLLIVSQIFSSVFWWYLLFWSMIIICFVTLGLLAIFNKKKKNATKDTIWFNDSYSRIKILFARIFLLIFSVGGLTLFYWMNIYNLYLDIPDYLNKNYNVVEGKAEIRTTVTRGYTTQSITINGLKLNNRQILNQGEYEGKILKIYYLPRSRYVMEIWY